MWNENGARMKLIITTLSPSIDSALSSRFGRCAYFLIVDAQTLKWEAHENPATQASSGAGIQAAQFVADQKPTAVISGDFGPHAFEALNSAGVPMYVFGSSETVRETINRYKNGQLQRVAAPTQECHHAVEG